ncbi:hypothetical protein SteCoe_23418 [Stentor coeruleus]|uniref:RanBP2-type domain-containing protein n=1 Tax=Stentor coeruleus TaxID=5963 RepID=A0A1R2BJY6_9CILI|nr:hypothetical protein SteCoe_23418 [Stentor coeruleus]
MENCAFSTETHPCKNLCCYYFEYKNNIVYACKTHYLKNNTNKDYNFIKFRKGISKEMATSWLNTINSKKEACDIYYNHLTKKISQLLSALKKVFNENIFQISADYISMADNFCQILIHSPYIDYKSYTNAKTLFHKDFILDESIILNTTFSTLKEILPEIHICDPEEYEKLKSDLTQSNLQKKEMERRIIDLKRINQELYNECKILKEKNAKLLKDSQYNHMKIDKQINIDSFGGMNEKKTNENFQRELVSPITFNQNIKNRILNKKPIVKENFDKIIKSPKDIPSEIIHSPLKNANTWRCLCGERISNDILVCISCKSQKPGEKGWVCKFCTNLNKDMILIRCSVCYLSKYADENFKDKYWKCTSCNSFNVDNLINCSSCKKSKIFEEDKSDKDKSTKIINKTRNKSSNISSNTCKYEDLQTSSKITYKSVRSKSIDGWICKKCKEPNENTVSICKLCKSSTFQTEKKNCTQCKSSIESYKSICDVCEDKNNCEKKEIKNSKGKCHSSCSLF